MDSAEANRMRWAFQRGHYEVWYATLSHLASRTGFWIRYTLEAPEEGHGEPYAQLWFARFDGNDAARTFGFNQKLPIGELRQEPAPFRVRIGDAELTSSSAKGHLAGDGHDASWDLRWTPAETVHQHLPSSVYKASLRRHAGADAEPQRRGARHHHRRRADLRARRRSARPDAPVGQEAHLLVGLVALQRVRRRSRRRARDALGAPAQGAGGAAQADADLAVPRRQRSAGAALPRLLEAAARAQRLWYRAVPPARRRRDLEDRGGADLPRRGHGDGRVRRSRRRTRLLPQHRVRRRARHRLAALAVRRPLPPAPHAHVAKGRALRVGRARRRPARAQAPRHHRLTRGRAGPCRCRCLCSRSCRSAAASGRPPSYRCSTTRSSTSSDWTAGTAYRPSRSWSRS